jgi:hypothetical protein
LLLRAALLKVAMHLSRAATKWPVASTANGLVGNGRSYNALLSRNASSVVFVSDATNLVRLPRTTDLQPTHENTVNSGSRCQFNG